MNYDDENGWPSDKPPGPSIYLTAENLSSMANDAGDAWRRSEPGVAEAIVVEKTEIFDGADVGSPGRVSTEPMPAESGGEGQGEAAAAPE